VARSCRPPVVNTSPAPPPPNAPTVLITSSRVAVAVASCVVVTNPVAAPSGYFQIGVSHLGVDWLGPPTASPSVSGTFRVGAGHLGSETTG
jgi:hypothetical protein